jgi:hypothetical protein
MSKHFWNMTAVVAVAVVGALAQSARADIQAVGYAEEGGSWNQNFSIKNVNNNSTKFDEMRLTMTPESGYISILEGATGTITQFVDPDSLSTLSNWAQNGNAFNASSDSKGNSGFLQVNAKDSTSADITQIQFKLHFTADASDGASFKVDLYRDGSLVGTEFITYRGTVIPLPPAAWSGLALLGGLGFMMARKRRSQILA